MNTRLHKRRSLLVLVALLTASSCNDDAKKQTLTSAPNNIAPAGPTAETPDDIVKVDPAELAVSNLYIIPKQEKKFKTHNMSVTADGRADFVEYLICPLEETGRTCPENTPHCDRGGQCDPGVTVSNWVLMPTLYAGKIRVKARACVKIEHSINSETCGPYTEQEYTSTISDAKRQAVEREIKRLREELVALTSTRYRDALETFMKESSECQGLAADVKEVLDSKRSIVEQYMRAPAAWFAQSAENLADRILGREGTTAALIDKVEDVASSVGGELQRICDAVGKGTHDVFCTALKVPVTFGKMMLSSLNPISAVATMSVAIHDIYYGTLTGQADKLVAKACYAEQNLQRSTTAIEYDMHATVTLLEAQKKELDRLNAQ